MTRLSDVEFLGVVANAPLVAIDLIVRSPTGDVLLGRRTNRPAQGDWFVPGGRVRKDERLREALVRIVRTELGDQVPVDGWQSRGVFEHHYADNFANAHGVTTHYVVLAAELTLSSDGLSIHHDSQHEGFSWVSPDALLIRNDVHPNTKAYFDPGCRPFLSCD